MVDQDTDQEASDDQYDGPWKEALEAYFVEFMAFFFEDAHAQIDWSRGHEFLDKELQQIIRDAELGRSYADKLVKVWLKNGDEQWIIVHVEVQGSPQRHFEERMYVYNYRTYDAHRKPVASLAILTDENENWNPDRFEYEIFGCRQTLLFRSVKLLKYRSQMLELEASRNVFAIMVLANLKTIDTRKKDDERELSLRILLELISRTATRLKHSESCFVF